MKSLSLNFQLFPRIAAGLAALTVAASCVNEPAPVNYVRMTIHADRAGEDPATKTERDESDGSVWWLPGDEIGVFFNEGTPVKFASTATEKSIGTEFEGLVEDIKVGSEYWAMYPYQEGARLDGTGIVMDLPSGQTATAGTFANGLFPAIGRSDSESVSFYNVCGGLRFSLFRDDIVKVVLTDNSPDNPSLAGTATVSFGEDGKPTVSGTGSGSVRSLELSNGGKPFEKDRNYYFIMYPVTFKDGFTVTFTDATGNSGSYTRGTDKSVVTIKRSVFSTLAALDTYAEWSPSAITERPCIETTNVKNYLTAAATAYKDDLDDYSKSIISAYSSGGSTPEPVTFSSPAEAATFRISLSGNFSKGTTVDLSTGAVTWGGTCGLPSTSTEVTSYSTTSISLYNLTPDEEYYYEFLDGDGNVLKRSVLSPVGPVRMVKLYGNARDLGGWVSESFPGKRIKYGKIYRGQQLSSSGGGGSSSGSSSSSLKEIFANTLGIKVDIDLRGLGSGAAGNDLGLADGYYWNYMVRQFMYPEKDSSSGSSDYDQSRAGETAGLYQAALRKILGFVEEDVPVYFHCIGGADRTGTVALLIEALCGVSELDINMDYELTSFASKRERTDTGSRPFKYLVQYLKSFEGSTFQDKVYTWATTQFSDKDPNTNAVVPALTADEIARLRELMLEPIPE